MKIEPDRYAVVFWSNRRQEVDQVVAAIPIHGRLGQRHTIAQFAYYVQSELYGKLYIVGQR